MEKRWGDGDSSKTFLDVHENIRLKLIIIIYFTIMNKKVLNKKTNQLKLILFCMVKYLKWY